MPSNGIEGQNETHEHLSPHFSDQNVGDKAADKPHDLLTIHTVRPRTEYIAMRSVASMIFAQTEPPPPWSEAVREQMKHLMKTHGLMEQFGDWGWAFRLSCLAILISTLVVLWLALTGRLRSAGLGVSASLVPGFFGGVALLSAALRYGGRFTSGTDYALMKGHYDGIPQLGDALSLPYSFYFGSISSLLCLIVFCITHVRDRRLPPSQ